MSPVSKRVVGTICAVVILLVAAFLVRIPFGPSAKEFQSQISQALPIGSSRERVVEFAKSHGMEQSYLQRERMINAMLRGVSKGIFIETSLYVRFGFDEQDRLSTVSVEEVSIGL
jgi:hypothetical protein